MKKQIKINSGLHQGNFLRINLVSVVKMGNLTSYLETRNFFIHSTHRHKLGSLKQSIRSQCEIAQTV